jgi:hypothetical protein
MCINIFRILSICCEQSIYRVVVAFCDGFCLFSFGQLAGSLRVVKPLCGVTDTAICPVHANCVGTSFEMVVCNDH